MLRAVFAISPIRPLRVLHVNTMVSDTSSRKARFASQRLSQDWPTSSKGCSRAISGREPGRFAVAVVKSVPAHGLHDHGRRGAQVNRKPDKFHEEWNYATHRSARHQSQMLFFALR